VRAHGSNGPATALTAAQGRPTQGIVLAARRHVAQVLVALGTGALLAAGVLEALLRLFPAISLPPSVRRELAWRARHAGAPADRTSDAVDAYSPLLGWELAANLHTATISSNSVGIRGQREFAAQPSPGVRRVLCVGDSFIFGEGLRDEETMPARLELALDASGRAPWEVLNLGVHGYGTDQQWLRLQHLGFAYHPGLIVLGVFEDDVRRNALSFRDYAKPYFDLVRGHLVLRGVPVPPPATLLSRPPRLPALYLASTLAWLPDAVATALPFVGLERTRAGAVTLAILDAVRRDVDNHGARLLVVYIPRGPGARRSRAERLVTRWAAHSGTPLLDLRLAYRALPRAARTRLYHVHWTAYGAAASARLVAAAIRRLAVS